MAQKHTNTQHSIKTDKTITGQSSGHFGPTPHLFGVQKPALNRVKQTLNFIT